MHSCMKDQQSLTHSNPLLRRPENISPPEPVPEPMLVDNTRLSLTERHRRLSQGLCLYCGASGHTIATCPVRPPRLMVSAITPQVTNMCPLTTVVQLTAHDFSLSVVALIDTGSAANFIAGTLSRQLNLPTTNTTKIYQIQSVTGQPLGRKHLRHQVGLINLRVGLLNAEDLNLLVLEDSTADVILGRLWLVQHNPILSWKSGEVRKWGESCFPDCFPDMPRASKLPPHRPWDCAIDLLLGEPVPRGRIYPLSIPEQKAMEEYIEEALEQECIRPSTSPAASSFFLVAKKDGGLRPCIDYWALNKITVKFRYPLPLVLAALEQLRGARIFTKLDLRSAYNLIRIREGDEWKTAFVTPTGHYEYRVMPYGLANSSQLANDSPYSRILCTRYSGSFSINSFSSTSMTSLYTPGVRPNIASTLRRSSNGYGRITCSLKQRNAPSINLQSNSWVTTSTRRASKWTRGR